MNNFVFSNPTKIIFGKDTSASIGSEVKKAGVKSVLLLYGKGSIKEHGLYDTVVQSLRESKVEYAELSGVKPNPVLSKVQEGIELCKTKGLEGILAVGGGSVYDSAKAIAAGALYEGSVWDFYSGEKKIQRALPIFGILTLSATGSEMNGNSVLTKEDEQKKWSLYSRHVYPYVSIIDPQLQTGLPANQTANAAVDILTHVFELYFDGTHNVDIMQEYSEGIMRTVIKHSRILMNEPDNYESRAQMAWCATMALNGTNDAGRSGGDWSSHMIEHSLSALYDVSHGAGLAVIFPAWARYVYEVDTATFERFAENTFGINEGAPGEKIEKALDMLKAYYRELGAPTSLRELGVQRDELENIADNAAMTLPMGTLRVLDRQDILNILEIAY